jgi:hypothetical protein
MPFGFLMRTFFELFFSLLPIVECLLDGYFLPLFFLPEFRDSYFKNNLPFIFFNMPTSLLRTFV